MQMLRIPILSTVSILVPFDTMQSILSITNSIVCDQHRLFDFQFPIANPTTITNSLSYIFQTPGEKMALKILSKISANSATMFEVNSSRNVHQSSAQNFSNRAKYTTYSTELCLSVLFTVSIPLLATLFFFFFIFRDLFSILTAALFSISLFFLPLEKKKKNERRK